MASGKFWSGALPANTDQDTGAVAVGNTRTVNINLVNRDASAAARVRIAIGTNAIPANGDYIEYDTLVPPNGVLERSGFAVGAGERIILRADTANVTGRIHGFEEVA